MKTPSREARNNYMVNERDRWVMKVVPKNHEADRNVSHIGKPAVMHQHFSPVKS